MNRRMWHLGLYPSTNSQLYHAPSPTNRGSKRGTTRCGSNRAYRRNGNGRVRATFKRTILGLMNLLNRIIALFLGRLRMGVIQTIIEYQWFSSRINGCQNTSFKKIEYNSKMFDEAFREIACRAGYDADDPLEEEDGGCKTWVALF